MATPAILHHAMGHDPRDHFLPFVEHNSTTDCRRCVPVQNGWMSWLKKDDDPQTLQAAHWSVQPTWVKLFTICIGLPAWAFLMIGIFATNFDDVAMKVATGFFTATALIQIVFVFQGYWNMDI
ncbi:hypothetical protein [Sphingobium sp. EM0848]|uniref:hypothetical protein n=1 Tax=Sphingobium sp. EM0848 TaxID=2743473 RepID=UPI00159C1F94|nr:hypothetical protein [Sphingobium sp. EM0848]